MPEAAGEIQVEVVLAWPRRHLARRVVLPADATVEQAVTAAGFEPADLARVSGFAVHGIAVAGTARLGDGDRLELLRPLQADPKEARRARAARQRRP